MTARIVRPPTTPLPAGPLVWGDRGACQGSDWDLFFDPKLEQRAVQVCSGCPVVTECAEWALAARESEGVWGGMTLKEREGLTHGRSLRHARTMARRRELLANPDDPRHGTDNGYTVGCRCDRCREGRRITRRQQRSSGRAA